MKQLFLVDASIYIFRAYFSLPDSLTDASGNPANAVYGFAGFLTRFLERSNARHVGVAFDESLTTSFRNEFYPEYKANRELPPPELETQLKACQELTQALGLASYVSTRYEADDLIGTLAHRMRKHEFSIVIVSGDKDLAQLIADGDTWWDFTRDRRLGTEGIKDLFGVHPHQIVDYLALTGDKVDNIPGVAGIGPKTAAQLLNRFDSLDSIYARLEEIPSMKLRGAVKVRASLKDSEEQAYLSQRLARIALDAPVAGVQDSLRRRSPNREQLTAFCKKLGFGEGMRRKLGLSS
ncbi:MAG: 5'-3' exonuclease H3TH domain-containing protein [Gammaproteobacteria bacterium]|nr:MAG: 5'-3' exonuclease H3TH domain-containing protein [Gammaproteobacteria bacterium]